MWIIYSIVIHFLLLGSIFVIYFRSPVITNLQPHKNIPLEAPAKRLVLIVTDGLRAESFYHENLKNVPNIKRLIDTKNGMYGISRTRVPTESRPGHIALIAGLYEDPSAVTKGWKENPTDFDTVFNRSSKTYAWGANDVLHIFSRLSREDEKRLFFDSYNHELDFSGKEKSYELDKWVFEKVKKFLQRKYEVLQTEIQSIYFLHLLGLDTAGHVYKPNTELFLENLNFTDRGVAEMYELFEKTFPDGKTAYILSSDHGMTDAGSHGGGGNYETETPFFIWGAGVNHKSYNNTTNNSATLYELEQAQIAPIMSALLGIATPMNNFGVLPNDILNVSQSYLMHAVQGNAYQIYNQYKSLLEQHEKGLFTKFLPAFKMNIDFEQYFESQNNYEVLEIAINNSYKFIFSALKGIDYYFSYYRTALLIATMFTFIAWLGYLLKLLGNLSAAKKVYRKHNFQVNVKFLILFEFAFMTLAFCVLQMLNWNITLYFMLPFIACAIFLNQPGHIVIFNSHLGLTKFQLFVLFLCTELLVYTFFDRKAISLGFLLFALHDKISKNFFAQKPKFYISFFLSLVLCIFPLLPTSVGYSNTMLLYFGICLTLLRSFVVKNSLSILDKIVVLTASFNGILSIYMHTQQIGVSIICHIISWFYLLYVVVSLVKPCSLDLKHRLEKLIQLLTSLYGLFCTSYESLFILLLITELIFSLDCSKYNNSFSTSISPTTVHVSHCFRLAFKILLYTFFSFFGTGNIASVSSFDPNIIRCFLSTFSPFVIMFLVILKLIIPVLLIISTIFALSPLALRYEHQIFICLLIICDAMGLNFLFLVKNEGSWLEIGSSISHFVIMQMTTVVLVLFVNLAKFLLQIKITKKIDVKLR